MRTQPAPRAQLVIRPVPSPYSSPAALVWAYLIRASLLPGCETGSICHILKTGYLSRVSPITGVQFVISLFVILILTDPMFVSGIVKSAAKSVLLTTADVANVHRLRLFFSRIPLQL